MIFGFNTDVKFGSTVYHVQSEARQHELVLQTQVFVKGRCIGKHAISYADKTSEPGFSEEHMHEMLKNQHKHFVAAVREGRIEAELAEGDGEQHELKAPAAPSTPAVMPVAAAASAAEAAAPAMTASVVAQPAVTPAMVTPPVVDASSAQSSSAPVDDLAAQFAAAVAEKPVDPGLSLTPLGGVIGKGLSLECLPPVFGAGGNDIIVGVRISDDSGPASGAQVSCRITSGTAPANYVYATGSTGGMADLGISLNGLDLNATALLIQASHRGKSASRKYSLKKAT